MNASDTHSSAACRTPEPLDLLVVGAGPTGMACAIEAQKEGLRVAIVEKGCLCNSLFHYPANMTFFTTSELLEIGGIPFPSTHSKPTRAEALEYYRQVAAYYSLDTRLYHRVERVEGVAGAFTVHTLDRFGRPESYLARNLVLATGYFDLPNRLGIPGEELSKVQHYYNDPHPYAGLDVVVVGGKNSAAIAALELWRHGARVTLVHRGAEMHRHVKYWIKPDLENRIKNGEIAAFFRSQVVEVTLDTVVVETPEGRRTLPNHFVLAMTGYHPDFAFLEGLGVRLEGPDRQPALDPETLESNVPGVYLAGVIVAGARTNEIFIENGRFHGKQIAAALKAKVGHSGARNPLN
ncbi:MAG: YpdA family putative bacillithiol disulfide reductase [Terracidiphilus sp.]|nr:YpdA family putative bacillithiol disulfide reductase [Terracidiphilus sp.]